MEKIFENVPELTTAEDYEAALSHVKNLIREATDSGALDDPEADNEYIREIGRLSHLGAKYEDEHIQFKHLKVRKKSPLIRSIEDEMYSRSIKQKQLAEILGVNEPALSQIICGKRSISMRMAKKLHKLLNIDPQLIMDYA
ncbi:MAG: helix-turn-helix transcriptional regulator [Prevotellaceae bacterium]|jgi:HTH-type transcriptional regulator/antitoxin HigA|nr:helix-turn-helix transcriptional regulator [Prevotellaceae bacterium]